MICRGKRTSGVLNIERYLVGPFDEANSNEERPVLLTSEERGRWSRGAHTRLSMTGY